MFEIENPTIADKELKILQTLELEILKEIDRICRKHNINYSLGGGSCLGQVRHGGFIPWDDDIDIDMTTDNYRKFLSAAETELDNNKFFLRTHKSDCKHLRSMSRLELKYTYLGQPDWDKIKVRPGIFVDLCELSYLPDEPRKRRRVASKLFYIRCTQNYKSFKRCAKKSPQAMRPLIRIGARILPNSFLLNWETKLKNITGGKRTGWVLDNAIINGNYGGYPSACVDEYIDVEFEGLTVMSKKDTDSFLKILYGDNYMEWLPMEKRISHHRWTEFDFGIYASQYDLPENYKEYILVTYSEMQLRQMKQVSLEAADALHLICEKHNLPYFIVGDDALYSEYDISEAGELWEAPLAVAMPRTAYEALVCEYANEFDNRFFLQEHRSDNTYYQPYARLRMNNTYIRENLYPGIVEESMHSGFFINIYPLDATTLSLPDAKNFVREIRKKDSWLKLKVRKQTFDLWWKTGLKGKVKLFLMSFKSFDSLYEQAKNMRVREQSTENSYYVSPEKMDLDIVCVDGNVFDERELRDYLGHKLYFLSLASTVTSCRFSSYSDGFKEKFAKAENYLFLKERNFDFYYKKVTSLDKKSIKKIMKRFNRCYLEFFDAKDYQLSVWRYDEKTNCFLTNKEIFQVE